MRAVSRVTGTVCPLDAADVDTDQIIPKQFLKRVERTGFGPFAFYEWRYDEDGEPRPDFPMNEPEHQGASILLTGPNFGCGSSREHAPWALQDAGFEAIIAPSFADIFRSNCGQIGVICVELPRERVRGLFDLVDEDPAVEVTVDLEARTVTTEGFEVGFDIDPHTRRCLLEGLDEIDLTLQHAEHISEFESDRPAWRPTLA